MKQTNEATNEWKDKLQECLTSTNVVSPRGTEVYEVINGSYTMPMPAYIDLKDRNVNVGFMLQEAYWLLSGSNRLDYITPYLKGYSNYSDDGVFMKGAYSPKIVDQLPYIVETIERDLDTRQAVLTTWRERPGPSKDVACTISMQFLVRDKNLHMIVGMRSNDIVKGTTFDCFSFSMIALAVKLLLKEIHDIDLDLGNLFVNASSLHLYSTDRIKAEKWLEQEEVNESIGPIVDKILRESVTYSGLLTNLKDAAENAKM